jgi:hypothetical protein
MQTYTYHREIRIIIAQVLNALADLVIRRLDETNNDSYVDQMDVGLKYVSKQRIIYDMTNLNQHIQLPAMAISLASIRYNEKRAFNKIAGFTTSVDYLSSGGKFPQPVPVDLTLPFSILSRYQRDLDQIITCIFSNFFPYIVISYKHPDLGHEVRCIVNWDGNINFTYPIDTTADTSYRIAADSSFTVNAWIFRNASNPAGVIYNIPTTFTSVSSIIDDYDTQKSYESPETTDYFTITGRPQLKAISPSIGWTNLSGQQYNLVGDMFQFVTNMGVSGIPVDMYTFAPSGLVGSAIPASAYNLYNPFVSSHSLSSLYTSFSAVSVTNWSIINDNNIQFTLPTPLLSGFVDIFAWGPVGFGKLTVDAIRPTNNPYISGTSDYNNYKEFQFPYVSGIEIK